MTVEPVSWLEATVVSGRTGSGADPLELDMSEQHTNSAWSSSHYSRRSVGGTFSTGFTGLPTATTGSAARGHLPTSSVHHVVDHVMRHGGRRLQKYELEASALRSTGGQAVVVMAVDAVLRKEVALKLFARQEHYERELAVYTGPLAAWANSKFLEDAVDNADNVRDALPDGTPLPSYLVMERGETMTVWLRRKRSPLLAHWLLGEVAEQLAAVHAAGYVHRDIKPANILWLPKLQEWRLIDWASAEPIGSTVAAGCTPPYAAPELVRAHSRSTSEQPPIMPSADIWALGVIAYEALTGEPFVPSGTSLEATIAQVLGDEPLQCERDSSMWKRIGRLAPLVQRMVSRDEAARPSASEVHETLQSLIVATRTLMPE